MLWKQYITVLLSCSFVACAGSSRAPDSAEIDGENRRGDCIFRASIRGYSVLDESNLVVDGSGNRKYHLTLTRRARGLNSSWGITFESPSGRVCEGFSEVVFDGDFGGEKVRIDSIRLLSPEEHEDLLIRYGKKEPEIERTPEPEDVDGADVEELDPAASGN